jgi:DNA-binding MarR family transcriptional regulator
MMIRMDSNIGRAQDALNSFRRIFRELRVSATRTQIASGLSAAQLFTLDKVASAPSSSFTELAQRTMTDRTSVRAAIRRLHEKKLVTIKSSPIDRRRTVVSITPAGRRILRKAPRTPADELLSALTSMSNAELRQLTRSLERLVQAMGITGAPATLLFDDSEDRTRRKARIQR